MRRKIRFLYIIGAILVVCVICIYSQHRSRTIFDNERVFWDAYIGTLSTSAFNDDGEPYEGMQENGTDYINYFIQAENVINICYHYKYEDKNEEHLAEAEEILKCLMNTFYTYGKFPRPEYKTQNYEYGWVSSMDAPTIMVASQMMYELTGEKIYSEFVSDMVPYIMMDTRSGGYNYIDKKGNVWPLEYARSEADEETNMYVLNGSLVGYISTKAMSMVLDDKELGKYCENVERCYKQRFYEFGMQNEWTYYMLNPKTVIPIHYLIFEEKLFKAAYYLNHDRDFLEQAEYRENLLNKVLGIEFYDGDSGTEFYMLRAASPHYYQIDTYGTVVEFYDKEDKVVEEVRCLISGSVDVNTFYEGMFLTGNIDLGKVSYYKVYSVVENNRYLLFQDAISVKERPDYSIPLEYQKKAVLDAFFINDAENYVRIEKSLDEREEGDIIYRFSEPHEIYQYIYLLEIENLADENIYLGLKMYNGEGLGVTRSYMPLLPGKNLIMFDARGFADSDQLQDIESIWIRFYDNNMKADFADVRLGELQAVSDYKTIYEYLQTTEYKINPQ